MLTSKPPSPARRALFWLGLPLLGLGLGLTAMFPPLIFIGGPVFLAGLALVWASGQPVWARALATVLPFAAWLGGAATLLQLGPREPATTFLIPEGFEGQIFLVLGEPCGLPPEKIDGRLVYRVPANGLIITQNKAWDHQAPENQYPNRGYYALPDNEYYVVVRQGRRLRELTELAETYDESGLPQTTTSWVGVGRDEVGVFPGSPIFLPGDMTPAYTFQTFSVSSFARLPRLYDENQPDQRALADSLVVQCRLRLNSQPARSVRSAQ